jgi:hypothetical protein
LRLRGIKSGGGEAGKGREITSGILGCGEAWSGRRRKVKRKAGR